MQFLSIFLPLLTFLGRAVVSGLTALDSVCKMILFYFYFSSFFFSFLFLVVIIAVHLPSAALCVCVSFFGHCAEASKLVSPLGVNSYQI